MKTKPTSVLSVINGCLKLSRENEEHMKVKLEKLTGCVIKCKHAMLTS